MKLLGVDDQKSLTASAIKDSYTFLSLCSFFLKPWRFARVNRISRKPYNPTVSKFGIFSLVFGDKFGEQIH